MAVRAGEGLLKDDVKLNKLRDYFINVAMANLDFLLRHGLMGIAEGGLLQFLSILAKGFLIVLFYFGFKGIEAELLQRWRNPRQK